MCYQIVHIPLLPPVQTLLSSPPPPPNTTADRSCAKDVSLRKIWSAGHLWHLLSSRPQHLLPSVSAPSSLSLSLFSDSSPSWNFHYAACAFYVYWSLLVTSAWFRYNCWWSVPALRQVREGCWCIHPPGPKVYSRSPFWPLPCSQFFFFLYFLRAWVRAPCSRECYRSHSHCGLLRFYEWIALAFGLLLGLANPVGLHSYGTSMLTRRRRQLPGLMVWFYLHSLVDFLLERWFNIPFFYFVLWYRPWLFASQGELLTAEK